MPIPFTMNSNNSFLLFNFTSNSSAITISKIANPIAFIHLTHKAICY